MQAVILAGGKGTRLRPLTVNTPKPLVPVGGIPIMEYTIRLLKKYGVKDIVISLGYLSEKFEEYFGDGSRLGVNLTYSYEKVPLGTAGAVKHAQRFISDTFIVASGDVLTDINLSDFLNMHRKSGALASIALTRSINPTAFGIVFQDEDGFITRFLEKPGWGEVFSDIINAGYYIMEPEVLDLIPKEREYDFSKDVFPKMVSNSQKLFGYKISNYWMDIGTPQKYLEANYDVLKGSLKIDLPYKKSKDGLWMGENVRVAEDCEIYPPAVIGDFCRLSRGAVIDRFSVLGAGCYVGEEARISRSVVWNNTSIHKSASLRSCVVGSRCEVGEKSKVLDGAIIGDDCILGPESLVQENILIWPDKLIQKNSIVNMNVIWGVMWKKSLFGDYGISGLANLEITPEFATKLGAAFGTYLGEGSSVVVGRDTYLISRMIKRAMIAGLQSAGVNVFNLRVLPTPLIEEAVRANNARGGISISVPRENENVINVRLFDSEGIDLNEAEQKKVEDIFFKEALRRSKSVDVGDILYPTRFVESYLETSRNYLDTKLLSSAKMRIVIDCADGSSSMIAPTFLRDLGCEVIAINVSFGESAPRRALPSAPNSLHTLSKTVKALDADLGATFDSDADRVLFVDERGEVVSGDTSVALLALAALTDFGRGSKIVVPISTSQIVDILVSEHQGEVIRTKLGLRPLAEAVIRNKAVFGGDETGGFIFPQIHPFRDGVISVAKLAEFLTRSGQSLSEIIGGIPRFYTMKESIPTPLQHRGVIMRTILENAEGESFDTIDGIKIYLDKGWVLIRPSSEEPVFDIFVEAQTESKAKELIKNYTKEIQEILMEIEKSTYKA
ncbi:MAG: sugar phosphate nucleotidyltransferase [Candidatus Jordarchaeaceae archaeon]